MEAKPNDSQSTIFKALAHPVRRSILLILQDGEHCVCHLEAYLNLRQAYLSQQLMVLREAGLVEFRRDGWNIYYRVVDEAVFSILKTTAKIVGQISEKPFPVKDCTCPHCSSTKEIS